MANNTKIDWCDHTYNPVYGCLNNCSFCYARKMAKRIAVMIAEKEAKYRKDNYITKVKISRNIKVFKDMIYNFKPIFLYSNFNKQFPGKNKRIFVNSMSDIYYWESEWMHKVLDKIKQMPQHNFLFLTKNPEVYLKYNFPINCWLGITVINNDQAKVFYNFSYLDRDHILFASVEPILEKIEYSYLFNADWIIYGLETGRKNIYLPGHLYFKDIMFFQKRADIPLFYKESIYKSYPHLEIIQEYPNES